MGDKSKTTKVVLDLDNKDFVSKLKDSLGLMGELGKTEHLSGMIEQFKTIGMIAGIAGAAILAMKVALDLTKEAEHVKQVESSFEMLSKSAGLAGETIKKDLVGAAKGLADDTDILQAANRAIVQMGSNAKVIPQTMELARKATVLFGGDLVQNFEAMNQALSNGNARALRQFGIVIDTDKVTKDYAKSIGTTADMLSEAGKKQAIMNAALEQAKQKYKDVDESTMGATNNMKSLMVQLGQLKEAIALAFEKFAGPTVRAATEAVAYAAGYWAEKIKSALGGDTKKAHEEHQDALKKEIELQKQAADAAGGGEDPRAAMVNQEKLLEGRKKFEKDLADLRTARSQADLDSAMSEEEATRAYNERIVAMSLEYQAKREQIKREFYDKGIISESQYQEAINQINQTEADKLKNYDQDLADARIKSLENYAAHSETVAQGITRTFAAESAKAKRDLTDYGKTGQIVFGALKNNAVKAFKGMGDGSKTAGEAMRGFMFGAIADTAEAKGTELLLSSIWPPNPLGIAGGGALIALSQALRSQAEGSKGVGGAGAGGGGGAGGGSSIASAEVAQKPEVKAEPKKVVSLNIHGSYFDTDQSRTRIMEMIRESGDFTDFNINKIGP